MYSNVIVEINTNVLLFVSFRGFLLSDYPADSAAPTIPHSHLSTGNKPVYCFQYSGETDLLLQHTKHNIIMYVVKVKKITIYCILLLNNKSLLSTKHEVAIKISVSLLGQKFLWSTVRNGDHTFFTNRDLLMDILTWFTINVIATAHFRYNSSLSYPLKLCRSWLRLCNHIKIILNSVFHPKSSHGQVSGPQHIHPWYYKRIEGFLHTMPIKAWICRYFVSSKTVLRLAM